jgi:hypothetical protein
MRLNRALNRPAQRRLDDYLVRRLDGRPARRPDYLARVCALIEAYLRRRRRLARAEPHIFGRHAAAYYTDFSLRLHYFEDAGKTGACRSDTA